MRMGLSSAMANRLKGFATQLVATVREVGELADQQVRDIVRQEVESVYREHHPSADIKTVNGIQVVDTEGMRVGDSARILFFYWKEVVNLALNVLYHSSPVDSGEYRNEHEVFVNGVLVDHIDGIGAVQEVTIANLRRYAMRLETPSKWFYANSGRKGQTRGWSLQSPQPPSSTYKLAASVVRARYGGLYQVRYQRIQAPGGYTVPALVLTDNRTY